ncbi:hypothetical protein LIER_38963 [Lithospermum erythrorhizon]|uniref:Integrase zinc-binding domain-containing protein n=1 Tax=Lithospermum erythrorhizon TaxID=34254 RepID=A0AAV3QA15_LITER
MYDEELYKKSWDDPLLRCVSQEDIPKIRAEVHQGWCGSHIGGRSLTVKITRIRYFWPILVKDAMNFMKKCDICERMGSVQHKPTPSMTPIPKPIPLAMWGINLVGKLPKAKGSLKYVVVTVDYFSKWVEAVPLKTSGSDNIVKFLWKHIITRFRSESKKGAWIDELPVVLWPLRTTPSHATEENPFSLVYGSEAVLPIEARLPTYRQLGFDTGENDQ